MSDWPPPDAFHARPRIKIKVKLPPQPPQPPQPPEPPPRQCRVCLEVQEGWTFQAGHPDICRWCPRQDFRGGGRISSGMASGLGWGARAGGLYDANYLNDMLTACKALEHRHDR